MKKVKKDLRKRDAQEKQKGATDPVFMFLINFFIIIGIFYFVTAIFGGVSFKDVVLSYYNGFVNAISGPNGIDPIWLTVGGIVVVLSLIVVGLDKILGGRANK